MSEINANIVIEPINLAVTPNTTNIGVTVDPIGLNLYTTAALAQGGVGELQYNNNGQLAGVPITTFDGNNLTLGTSANVKLTGGTNGYFLQTDGTGNLTWNAGVSAAGNGIPGGANSQIQFNDGTGNFGGVVGFTHDVVTGNTEIANINVVGALTIQQAKEKVTTSGTSVATLNFNVLDQAIILQTIDATQNTILNIRGNASTTLNSTMDIDQSMTITWINQNGPLNAYILSSVQIDGVTRTIKWVQPEGAPIAGTYNGNDMYNLNIIKTASDTYTIFANRISYL
jgi:hypothetical protein